MTGATRRRLSKADRHRQLLDTALAIVREEGADRLTLGHLATRSGISKPVAYDHFESRSGLLIELYRMIDIDRVNAFREAMRENPQTKHGTVRLLAEAYIDCAADMTSEFHAIGSALGGSAQKAAVFQELLDNCVQMFVDVLRPFSTMDDTDLARRCMGLVGAGEALSAAVCRDKIDRTESIEAFAAMVDCTIRG